MIESVCTQSHGMVVEGLGGCFMAVLAAATFGYGVGALGSFDISFLPPGQDFFGPPNAQIPKTPPSMQKHNGPAPPPSPQDVGFGRCAATRALSDKECLLLDLVLKAVAGHQLGDVVLISLPLLALLHVLVALGKLAERRERVGAELVEDAGDELRELLVLTVAVDGECVCRDGGVDCTEVVSTHVGRCRAPSGCTYPWGRQSE